MFTASTERIELLDSQISEKMFFFQIVILWLAAGLAFLAAGVLIRPFTRLRKVLGIVADGDLEQDIMVGDYKETREIFRCGEPHAGETESGRPVQAGVRL